MKKTILLFVAFVLTITGAKAQTSLVATISQNGSVVQYYGATALQEAYEAASNGAVITLSPGVFNAVDIEKAITVRGAGMVGLESNGYESTQLTGSMTINVPSGTSSVLTIEGVHVLNDVTISGNNLAPVNIIKCRFDGNVSAFGINMSAHASIFEALGALEYNSGLRENTTLNCNNCVIRTATSEGLRAKVAKIIATNCLLGSYTSASSSFAELDYSILSNSIFIHYYPLPNTCSAQNCLGLCGNDLFVNIVNPSNVMSEGSGEAVFASIFKSLASFSSKPSITETFELTETAAATYLGNDGTQVGIYGGSYPFDPTPTNPQVKKFSVSNTTDGDKLKVKITVE